MSVVHCALQSFRFEGLSLTVENVDRSIEFYEKKLGLKVAHNASPHFALRRSEGGGRLDCWRSKKRARKALRPRRRSSAEPSMSSSVPMIWRRFTLGSLQQAYIFIPHRTTKLGNAR